MTNTIDSHTDENLTPAFTLPSASQKQEQQQQQQSMSRSTAKTPLHSTAGKTASIPSANHYEEFTSTATNGDHQSPSIPWLLDYWGSSFLQVPDMFVDGLCSCTSTVEPPGLESTHTIISTHSNSIASKKSYFDDTILRSDPKVNRSPTKISSIRWEALRAVVASHGDYTVQDYCDFYDKTVETMPSIEETEDCQYTSNVDSIYPTKSSKFHTRSLADDSKDDEDVEMEEGSSNYREDDDIRMQPPVSTAASESCPLDLNRCHSFDNTETTQRQRFLCSSEENNAIPATPPHYMMTPPLNPPINRLPDRRRSRHASLSHISPRTLSYHRLTNNLQPPSPAPSAADTYTTISLSQSFAREFDEDDDSQGSLRGGSLFLDRLAAETVTDPSRSPFRRLRPRTTMSNNNGHEDEKKEETENNEIIQNPTTPPRKRSYDEEDPISYRCLVRMSPDNYKHGKALGGSDDFDWWERHEVPSRASSSASSSVLLPLHPHQRIIAPLPDDFESEDAEDHSGYTCFRPYQEQRHQIVIPDF